MLERMRRGYNRHRYLDRVDKLRTHVPEIALSTDIIVGYPGETRAEFQETLDFLQDVKFDQVYSFIYSPRPGTAAQHEQDGVPTAEKQDRLAELQAVQQEIQLGRNRSLVGSRQEVLVDGSARQGRGQLKGRSRSNRVVNFPGDCHRVGEFLQVFIESAGANSLEGRIVPASGA